MYLNDNQPPIILVLDDIHDMDMTMGVKLAQSFFNKNNSRSYDRLVKLATLGQDLIWKKKLVESVPKRSLVLEMACGTGILTSLLKQNYNKVDLPMKPLHIKTHRENTVVQDIRAHCLYQ